MPFLYFSDLPKNVARSVFREAIAKYCTDAPAGPVDGPQQFIVHLPIPDKGTAEYKHDGYGSIEFRNDTLLMEFWAKLKTEPIMYHTKKVHFSREPIKNLPTPNTSQPPSQPQAESVAAIVRPDSVAESHASSARTSATMNLNRVRYKPQPERTGPKPPNPMYERKLKHRLSVLGQHARLERLDFGVLRSSNFSSEYSQNVLDSSGYLSFEDNQKSLRVILGGTHDNHSMPSIAITIQNVNSVSLGHDFGKPYMFLELLHNPHFEHTDAYRPSKGSAKEDARRARTRHSALDPPHRRVAPYTSRWLKLTFYSDGFYPNAETCGLAGLPPPNMDPQLTFSKHDMYSQRNVDAAEKWLRSGSLPWEVAFQCEALFRNGILAPQELLLLRPAIQKLTQESTDRACDVLISFRTQMEGASAKKKLVDFRLQNTVPAFEKHIEDTKSMAPLGRLKFGGIGSNFMCYHVKITPTAILLNGPYAEQSNRVIRRYPGYESNFIRVSFTEEGDDRSRFDFEVDTNAFSDARVGRFLKTGLQIGDRHYALLGYSQSGFRDHACFFSSDFVFEGGLVTPESIRVSLGDFSKVINQPARYGARMSQAFSSTDPSITISKNQIVHIQDIKTKPLNNEPELEFSDGCGTISRELAREVWEGMKAKMPATRRRQRHKTEPIPCAFQIRIGGSKGMVRLDPKLTGKKLCLRPSMTKFQPKGELTLEIARAFERPTCCLLNRPLIMLMWTGGVESSVFENMMAQQLESTVNGMKTFAGAAQLLLLNRLGNPFHLPNIFTKLSKLKLELDQEGVQTAGLAKLMNASLFRIKMDLKFKARLFVKDSYTLVGVCDEDNYLRPRDIYACVQQYDHASGKLRRHYLRGRMLVTRSPVIHPGDAQILWAIGEPPKDSPFAGEDNHLPNCVVFSAYGRRPVPNMLGGGDLDGDLYNLITLPELIPPHIYMPASYPAPENRKLKRPSTIDDIADFMIKYICNDALGVIATNHLIIASSAEMRARDENCMVNAALHSQAVDFVKTGFYVSQSEIRRPRYDKHTNPITGLGQRPDWQAGYGRETSEDYYYECDSVIGKLFRAVELPKGNPARESVEAPQAPTAIFKQMRSLVAKYHTGIRTAYSEAGPLIQALLSRYSTELNHICLSHTVSSESNQRISEVEVMLGTNLETTKEGGDLQIRMKRLTYDLADFVRHQLQGDEDGDPAAWLGRAWKAYELTYSLGDTKFGAFSFSWIALGSVLDALNTLDENFLPVTELIFDPLPAADSSEAARADLHQFAEINRDEWEWDDEEEETNQNEAGTPASPPSQSFRPTGNGQNSRGGGNQRGGYANGNGYDNPGRGGRGRGWGRGRGQPSPRGSYNGAQASTQTNGNGQTNGSSRTGSLVRSRGYQTIQK